MMGCTPGEKRCGASGDIEWCNSAGTTFEVRETCPMKSCSEASGQPACMAAMTICTPNQPFCGMDNKIYYCDSQGQVSGVREVCGAGEVCGSEGNAPVCITGYYEMLPNGMTQCVVTDPRTCARVQKAGSPRGFVYAEVNKSACDQPATIVCECGPREECSDGMCTSSVADTSSPTGTTRAASSTAA